MSDHLLSTTGPAASGLGPAAGERTEQGPTSSLTPRRLRCPHCQNPIQLSDGHADEVFCPGCGDSFRVCDARHTATASRRVLWGSFSCWSGSAWPQGTACPARRSAAHAFAKSPSRTSR